MNDQAPEDVTEAEALGLLVAGKLADAQAKVDQWRVLACLGMGHLRHVLDTTPQGTFAGTNTAQEAAREWLAAVRLPDSPEQEPTT